MCLFRTMHSLVSKNLAGWERDRVLPVLELAHMWEYSAIEAILIEKLDQLFPNGAPLYKDCVDNIVAVHKHHLKSRCLHAYAHLAKREQAPSPEERERLGEPFLTKMMEIREKYIINSRNKYRAAFASLRQEYADCIQKLETGTRKQFQDNMYEIRQRFNRGKDDIDMPEVESALMSDLAHAFGLAIPSPVSITIQF